MQSDILTAIKDSALMAGLPDPLRTSILCSAQVRRASAGEAIFSQGETAGAVYILAGGWIKLYRITPSGTEIVVSVLKDGHSFGEELALRDAAYSVSAEAITDVTLVCMDAVDLRLQMQDDPKLAVAILAASDIHLQALVLQVEQLKARSGLQRVAEFLADLAECDGGKFTVELPYNKTLIAGHLGLSPETLSRAFARLRHHGVRIKGSVAHIHDVSKLHDVVAEDLRTAEQ